MHSPLRHLEIAPIQKHKETTTFSHVLPEKPFHRKDRRINLSSLHAQEGQESKVSTKAKEKKIQVTVEVDSLRQDDVTQDMASATHDLSDVRRKCLRTQQHESGYGETEYFIFAST